MVPLPPLAMAAHGCGAQVTPSPDQLVAEQEYVAVPAYPGAVQVRVQDSPCLTVPPAHDEENVCVPVPPEGFAAHGCGRQVNVSLLQLEAKQPRVMAPA